MNDNEIGWLNRVMVSITIFLIVLMLVIFIESVSAYECPKDHICSVPVVGETITYTGTQIHNPGCEKTLNLWWCEPALVDQEGKVVVLWFDLVNDYNSANPALSINAGIWRREIFKVLY